MNDFILGVLSSIVAVFIVWLATNSFFKRYSLSLLIWTLDTTHLLLKRFLEPIIARFWVDAIRRYREFDTRNILAAPILLAALLGYGSPELWLQVPYWCSFPFWFVVGQWTAINTSRTRLGAHIERRTSRLFRVISKAEALELARAEAAVRDAASVKDFILLIDRLSKRNGLPTVIDAIGTTAPMPLWYLQENAEVQ